MTTMMEHALAYAESGWAVFPLKPRAKEPLLAGAYKVASKQLEQIEAWWTRWPEANIGLATGRTSGVWVLDLDGEIGARSFLQLEAEHGKTPDTLTASTGKGWHLYWRMPDCDVGRRIGVRPGIDVCGGLGYVLAPPSVHPSGAVYGWISAAEDALEAPAWVVDLVRPQPRAAKVSPAAPGAVVVRSRGTGKVKAPSAYLRALTRTQAIDVARAPEGQRNQQLFRSAVFLASQAAGLRMDDSEAMRDLWHAARQAGLADAEIERTLESARAAGHARPAQVEVE